MGSGATKNKPKVRKPRRSAPAERFVQTVKPADKLGIRIKNPDGTVTRL